MIYFDHNATTPIDEGVLEAMMPYLSDYYGNPSSLYRLGRISRSAIENARAQVAALVNAAPSQVIFTSGGTEANNLAVRGVTGSLRRGIVAHGATEHPSVIDPIAALSNRGYSVQSIEVDSDGRVSQTAIDELLQTDNVCLVSIMFANNETGVIETRLAEFAAHCRERNIVFHTDAVQAAGKINLDFATLRPHLMTVSSHKIYGPKGVGALIIDPTVPLRPLQRGGQQEQALRGGTENLAGIVGFGKAAEIAVEKQPNWREHTRRLTRRLETGLAQHSDIKIFAQQSNRLGNTVQFGTANIDGEMLLMELDRKGIAVSSGSACSSGSGKPSHVLKAMGVEDPLAKSAVRVSVGRSNTTEEIDRFLESIGSLLAHLRPAIAV